ncbi:TonB-dependent receptor plug domain-containing protein [Fluviispira multicolorata]|uniref:TonB-dependent receptor plug domain-containing protein n=1 Tax=Fluviispira multicolorata TaxID=2654512 RepID=A0A833N527_9BACT|nr:TonB-dependent receptor plug domain-containing protein [Fluviispira multicolorata]KAB8033427.1 TonB-dependent receptor plug domain-containing protein [Fluviispira multicolorata]
MKIFRLTLTLLFMVGNYFFVFAQSNKLDNLNNITLTGQVRPLGDLSPIENALVINTDNKLNFVKTNKNGIFSITVPKETKGILIRAENYQDLQIPIENSQLKLSSPYLLEPSAEYGGTGIIRARRKDEVSQNTFQQEEMAHVAGTGGDAVRALQTLPSVLPANVGSADVVVRGGSPGDNSFYYDDLLLPFIFHFGGTETIIPTRMIESMDFYPGAFSAYYTDTIGGVIQLRSFNSIPKRFSGEIEVGLIQSGIFLEGNAFGSSIEKEIDKEKNSQETHIIKNENEKNGQTNQSNNNENSDDAIGYRIGFRRTYLELYKPLIAKLANNTSFVTIPQATDYQMILNGNHSRGTWQIYLLGANDSASLSAPIGNSTTASGQNSFSFENYMETAGFKYNLNLGNGLGFRVSFQQRYYLLNQSIFGNNINIESQLYSFSFILDKKINELFSYSLGVRPKYQHYEAGLNVIQLPGGGMTTSFDSELAPVVQDKVVVDSFYGDAFVDIIFKPINKLTINPGLNMIVGSHSSEFAIDPRIGVRYEFIEGQTLKAGGGYYSQYPQPQYNAPRYGNPNLELERSIQYAIGYESKFWDDYFIDIQSWIKSSDNLVGPAVSNPNNKYENSIEMRAKGVEFFLKKKASGIWFGWMSYGISQSEQRDPGSGEWRYSNYDRTHSVNIVYGQKITSRWNAGTRIQFMTGTPYSTVSGGVYNENTGKYSPVSDGNTYLISKNDARIPYFFEVDFRTEYDFLFQDWKLTSYLDILNVFNRSNVANNSYNRDYTKQVYITGLPILPSIGVIAKF